MHKTNFLVGMGIGVTVGSAAVLGLKSGKKSSKNIIGKTLKTMGEIADAVSDSMGM